MPSLISRLWKWFTTQHVTITYNGKRYSGPIDQAPAWARSAMDEMNDELKKAKAEMDRLVKEAQDARQSDSKRR